MTNLDNCLGGNSSFTCAPGYVGALCASCDINRAHSDSRWTNKQQFECAECPDFKVNFTLYVLSFL